MTFFDCTAELVGQLNGNGQKGLMLQIDAPPVENFWLCHWSVPTIDRISSVRQPAGLLLGATSAADRSIDSRRRRSAATAPQHGAQPQMRNADSVMLTAVVEG